MFSEKLTIKNFGPFTEEVGFEFNKISVIIGPQASGKSIIAKLSTIFRKIESDSTEVFYDNLRDLNVFIFLEDESEISYISPLYTALYKNKSISINISEKLNNIKDINSDKSSENFESIKLKIDNLLQKADEIPEPEKKGIFLSEVRVLFEQLSLARENLERHLNNVENNLNGLSYVLDSYYIPSERLFYSMFKDSLASIIKADVPLPKILIDFGAMIENFRNNSQAKVLEFQDIKFENGGDDLTVLKGGSAIPVSYASSGIQSLYPILLTCQAIKEKHIHTDEEGEFLSVTIEEPELNLYPEAQSEIIKRIIDAVNDNDKVRLTITTHSPYILTTINNLLFKSKVCKIAGEKEGGDAYISQISLNDKIDFEDIAAYYISEGKADNLIDSETQLINAKKLDSISYSINTEFSELMTIYRKLNG